ncbi:MAG: phosphoadenosine phosphosulfate reductase family protein [Clostridiales bacterium]|nr:phosphoadenosine phosphosulfate reductase family protein [Clostridiales bacterium]
MERIRLLEERAVRNNPKGFVVCDSGGKDSSVIKQLAYLSGARFEIIHNHTTVDHPETVYFIREEKKRWEALGIPYTISYPMYKGVRTTFWELIPLKGPPLRIKRWCCDILKESQNQNRYIITGVRWEESAKRKKSRSAYEIQRTRRDWIKLQNDNDIDRKLTEICQIKGNVITNPIIDWELSEVWEFVHRFRIRVNPLYHMGWRRIGCVGCAMSDNKFELENTPAFKRMYLRAFQKCVESKPLSRYGWHTGQDLYDWWVGCGSRMDPDQISMFDFMEEGDEEE